jgi:hybrid cluster-associated redox disulfide protein
MTARVDPDQTVEQILRIRPQGAHIFIRRRMACVGCVIAPFESLRTVARRYGIDEEAFLAEFTAIPTRRP